MFAFISKEWGSIRFGVKAEKKRKWLNGQSGQKKGKGEKSESKFPPATGGKRDKGKERK